jgi:hypothetical protein
MLSDLRLYEHFVYTLPQRYRTIRNSTLVVIPHGAKFAELSGVLLFDQEIRLSVWEDLDFEQRTIQAYSYGISHGEERLYWYDPQPHPHHPELASTHPHHKHVPPNIKRNRIPAPGLSFTKPNLPYLIEEIEQELLGGSHYS